ncbi:MAG: acetyl-CoA carboxylase biotin carboxylase subunit [Deltaproteobacteria bacterium]|nr:acetyl-CoA carboxylase biotin carboxylase subunit [Deltaproteobacteria bacterium]
MFDKILIANRGEIAVRIIRTCQRLGVGAVAVYSEADHRSPFVRQADEAVFIGGARATESYLDKAAVVEAALSTGCAAVHPGYGFLSENAEFAQRVRDAGLVFIGPPPSAIATLGDKMASKVVAIRAGVPVVPGHHEPLRDVAEALEVGDRVGYPLLLKPAAGGGGRGMRIVTSRDELPAALAACREETRKAFGDERIFVERYVTRPRHIEIQILADHFGNVVHLGERECSIQRRYQKVIEETPSPAVSEELRAEMGRVACALAREVGYTNAGTVEFILEGNRDFYFLEMNTRLQVEHPVTELVTGLDLVEHQLRIASGEPLSVGPGNVAANGWAIEARICAEDPGRGFLPTTGMVTRYAEPREPNVRVDSGIDTGSVITIFYDSLLAKVAAWGATRDEAQRVLARALNGYHIEGLVTNVDFASAILNHPAFLRGDLSTDFIEQHFKNGVPDEPPPPQTLHFMVLATVLVYFNRRSLIRESLLPMSPHVGKAPATQTIRSYVVRAADDVFRVELRGAPDARQWSIRVDDATYDVVAPEFEFYRRRLNLKIDGASHMFRLQYEGSHLRAYFAGIIRIFEIYTPREWELTQHMLRGTRVVKENTLKCPMPGLITAIVVEPGAQVQRGQELVRMESMKMESGIPSPCDGRVDKILVAVGSAVETDEVLLTFAP